MPPLSLGPPVVRPFKTTVVRPGGNLTRIFLAQTVPAIKSIPTSTKSETRFIDCPFRLKLANVKDRYFVAAFDVKQAVRTACGSGRAIQVRGSSPTRQGGLTIQLIDSSST